MEGFDDERGRVGGRSNGGSEMISGEGDVKRGEVEVGNGGGQLGSADPTKAIDTDLGITPNVNTQKTGHQCTEPMEIDGGLDMPGISDMDVDVDPTPTTIHSSYTDDHTIQSAQDSVSISDRAAGVTLPLPNQNIVDAESSSLDLNGGVDTTTR